MLENWDCDSENDPGTSTSRNLRSTRKSLNDRFNMQHKMEREIERKDDSTQLSQSFASWCDTFSSLPGTHARQALKSGAEKITQTLNTVRTTFGTLSQKFRKSTRRRQPLKNIDSPKTPMTPYTKSRNMLGRTPTKLYSPFSIETPGKENVRKRTSTKRASPVKPKKVSLKKKLKEQKEGHSSKLVASCHSPGMKFPSDIIQTQIGIYELQSTANSIIQRNAGKS